VAYKFKDIGFNSSVRPTNDRNLVWSNLFLHFTDVELDYYPSVELHLVLPVGPDVTIRELENLATDRAKTILRAALDLLEGDNVTGLLDSQAAQQKADRAQRPF
jgi:hypothetical protein